jgi:hypothetical protein
LSCTSSPLSAPSPCKAPPRSPGCDAQAQGVSSLQPPGGSRGPGPMTCGIVPGNSSSPQARRGVSRIDIPWRWRAWGPGGLGACMRGRCSCLGLRCGDSSSQATRGIARRSSRHPPPAPSAAASEPPDPKQTVSPVVSPLPTPNTAERVVPARPGRSFDDTVGTTGRRPPKRSLKVRGGVPASRGGPGQPGRGGRSPCTCCGGMGARGREGWDTPCGKADLSLHGSEKWRRSFRRRYVVGMSALRAGGLRTKQLI